MLDDILPVRPGHKSHAPGLHGGWRQGEPCGDQMFGIAVRFFAKPPIGGHALMPRDDLVGMRLLDEQLAAPNQDVRANQRFDVIQNEGIGRQFGQNRDHAMGVGAKIPLERKRKSVTAIPFRLLSGEHRRASWVASVRLHRLCLHRDRPFSPDRHVFKMFRRDPPGMTNRRRDFSRCCWQSNSVELWIAAAGNHCEPSHAIEIH